MSETHPAFFYTSQQRGSLEERSINKLATFCGVLEGQIPEAEQSFSVVFQNFDSAIRQEYPAVKPGALNNAHGDWYEWLLSLAAWNLHRRQQSNLVALTLPNIRQFDWATLYTPDLFQMIEHLRTQVKEASDVQLISSNPDFVILDLAKIENSLPVNLSLPTTEFNQFAQETIQTLEGLHRLFIGQCRFDAIVGFIAAKSSFRPDRRLQIPHEGSLIKAIYVHLQTRQWVVHPRGIKYYAIGGKVGESDIQALKTVATHSIVTVSSTPQAAVDQVFEVNSMGTAETAFAEIFRQLGQFS